jgi:hypothetical protein
VMVVAAFVAGVLVGVPVGAFVVALCAVASDGD